MWLRGMFEKYRMAKEFRVPPARTYEEMAADEVDAFMVISNLSSEKEELEQKKHEAKIKNSR